MMQDRISNDIMFDLTMDEFMNESNKPAGGKFAGYTVSRVQKEKRDAEYKKLFNYNTLVRTHRDYQRESIEKLKKHEDDMKIFQAIKEGMARGREDYGQSYKNS